MPKPNATRFALLGLLDLEPMTGYDVKQFVEENLSHFWNESYRWIYATLGGLEAEGLAASRAEQRGPRGRRSVYRITRKGKRALEEWLAEPAEPLHVRDELLLKLFLGKAAGARASARRIKRHQQMMQAQERELARDEREHADVEVDAQTRLYLRLTIRHARRVTAARLRWCDEALRLLSSRRRRKT